MNTQTLTTPVMLCNFILASEEPIFANTRDYGFDFDEEEIGRELLAPLPADLLLPAISEAAAVEFEKALLAFLS
ncbi:MAG: hypothetical protein HY867_07480 [Chloroflexi bacterium]|nr:hypothetical protein [Chloroflexota bacterium]